MHRIYNRRIIIRTRDIHKFAMSRFENRDSTRGTTSPHFPFTCKPRSPDHILVERSCPLFGLSPRFIIRRTFYYWPAAIA